jgi:hypothetical protein
VKQVASLLNSLFRNLGIEDRVRIGFLQKEWRSVFNEPLSLHTYPADIKDGELLVNVDSPAWLGQLKFFKADMIQKLQAYNVKEIRFRQGRVFHGKGQEAEGKTDPRQKDKEIPDSDLQWIDQTVSAITDADLKEDIKKTIEKALRRRG